MASEPLKARCYCGSVSFEVSDAPVAISYCHCSDCKRWTGAPLPAFAAFAREALNAALPAPVSINPGVERRNCPRCGSPLTAEFDYLPGQTYVPLGIFENADSLQPDRHAHAESVLPWLNLEDELPRHEGSARDALRD